MKAFANLHFSTLRSKFTCFFLFHRKLCPFSQRRLVVQRMCPL